MSYVAIVDYGMGNLHSVAKAVETVGGHAKLCAQADQIDAAERVIFPGVGAFGDCMQALDQRGLHQAVIAAAANKPFLGVCLGMQLLMDNSEEHGLHQGLGIFPGQVRHFANDLYWQDERLKIPHMGWNQVHQRSAHPLWQDIPQDNRFYFVHSYYVEPAQTQWLAASTDYPAPFCSALARDNIFAVQFHPEKSQRAGLALYRNFLAWDGLA